VSVLRGGVWSPPIQKGITPSMYTYQTNYSWPQRWEPYEQIEVWPAADQIYSLRIFFIKALVALHAGRRSRLARRHAHQPRRHGDAEGALPAARCRHLAEGLRRAAQQLEGEELGAERLPSAGLDRHRAARAAADRLIVR
jgi:hypothetical protein